MLHFIKIILPLLLPFIISFTLLVGTKQIAWAQDELANVVDNINDQLKATTSEYQSIVKQVNEKSKEYSRDNEVIVKLIEQTTIEQNKTKPNMLEQMLDGYKNIKQSSCEANNLENQEGLWIFVSFSMPKNLLAKYDKVARHIGAKLVIRGLKNNSFKETIDFIKEIGPQGASIAIHPQIFRKFKVNSVPSFVINSANIYDKLTGNVTISYVLDKFINQGDLSKQAQDYRLRLETYAEK